MTSPSRAPALADDITAGGKVPDDVTPMTSHPQTWQPMMSRPPYMAADDVTPPDTAADDVTPLDMAANDVTDLDPAADDVTSCLLMMSRPSPRQLMTSRDVLALDWAARRSLMMSQPTEPRPPDDVSTVDGPSP